MTILNRKARIDGPSHFVLRVTTLLFTAILGLQCIWLLLAEIVRPGSDQLPTDIASAAVSAQHRNAASWAASIGAFRGDLWAQSAFTYADLLWGEKGELTNADLQSALTHARASLDHALNDSPHRADAWLLLAGLALRYPSLSSLDPSGALKMSYYTGASEQDLMPLRLDLAVRSDTFSDVEMRQFVSRDIRLLLAQKQKSATADAYVRQRRLDGASSNRQSATLIRRLSNCSEATRSSDPYQIEQRLAFNQFP